MKININRPFKDLSGNDVKESNQGKLLADWITKQQFGNSLQYFAIALDLWKTGEAEIDNLPAFISLIEQENNGLNILTKAQILQSLKEQVK